MRRSALTDGTPGEASAAPRSRRRGRAGPRCGAGASWLLLPLTLLALAALSSASPRWSMPEDFPDGFRNPDAGTPLDGLPYDADVIPEERAIDQMTAYLKGQLKLRQQLLPPPMSAGHGRRGEEAEEEEAEEEDARGAYEELLEEAGLLPPPSPAREGRGPGFTYRFPERGLSEQDRGSFAVNPSDPKYYTATVMGRSGGGSESESPGGPSPWDSMGESEARELEGGGPSDRIIKPLGRFPVVKPIKVVSTSGTDIPPIHDAGQEDDAEEVNLVGTAGGAVSSGAKGGGKVDKADMRMSHDGAVLRGSAGGGSTIPAEQVKRERPDKVPLNFGSDAYLTAIISGCTAAAVVGVIAFAIFWYRLQRNAKAAADVEYPAYGVTGPNQEASAVAAAAAAAASNVSPTPHSGGSTSPLTAGDRRLAQSAQMYHYQHQKQQIIAMESRTSNERRGSVSEVDSEEENEEGDYTVYECPGLAPTGEMEVKNPLFHDDPTPATPSGGNNGRDQRGGNGGGSKP